MSKPSRREFEAELVKPDEPGTWTYLVVPFSVEEVFGRRGLVKVKGTVNGFPFRSSLFPRGDGSHYLVVNRDIREGAGAGRGDRVRVELEEDREPRVVEVPPELAAALDRHPDARAAFERLAPSHRREYVNYIREARKPETRLRRVEKTIQALSQGNKEIR